MRRLTAAVTPHLRIWIATAAISWGLTVLSEIHAERSAALDELEADADAAEARLARLMEAEEEQHEARRLGQVVPGQREGAES